MLNLDQLDNMSKEQRDVVILAMPAPANASPEERQHFEFLRQIALGRKLTTEEQQALEAANIYKKMRGSR